MGYFSGGDRLPSLKIVINFPRTGPKRSYIVNENNIGSAVSEILWDRQTDTDPVTFSYRILDKYFIKCCRLELFILPL